MPWATMKVRGMQEGRADEGRGWRRCSHTPSTNPCRLSRHLCFPPGSPPPPVVSRRCSSPRVKNTLLLHKGLPLATGSILASLLLKALRLPIPFPPASRPPPSPAGLQLQPALLASPPGPFPPNHGRQHPPPRMATASGAREKGYVARNCRTASRILSALSPGSRRSPAVALSDTGVLD